MSDYSIWVVECGHVAQFPVGAICGGRFNAGTRTIPFGYVVLQGEGHLAVVDTGYRYSGQARAMADATPVVNWRSPSELMSRLGFKPTDVDTVLLTHAHWDHAGNLEAFPNAQVVLQERELEQWRRLLERPARYSWLLSAIDPTDFETLARFEDGGRLRLLDGDTGDVLPGIDLLAAHETHTPGHQVAVISAGSEAYIAAGDTVMAFENLAGPDEAYVPVGSVYGSQLRLLESYDRMLGLVGGDPTHVIPVHDAACWARYPSIERDGSHIAEVHLALGARSRVEGDGAAADA
jgi:glyoxylase-like metal-dependent hydrolase (beta-lactamase superfamily II)